MTSRWNTVWAALWCVALYLSLGVVSTVVRWVEPAPDIVLGGAAHVLVLAAFCHLVLVVHERRPARGWSPEVVAHALGLGRAPARELGLGVLLGLAAKAPADSLRAVIEHQFPTPEVQLAAQAEMLRHDSVGRVVGLLLLVGLLGPLLEELFYRGVAFRLVDRGSGRRAAILLSAAFFALAHHDPRDWLPLWLVALLLGQARASTGRVWAVVGAHVAFNSAALGLHFADRSIALQGASAWLWLGGAILICGTVLASLSRT